MIRNTPKSLAKWLLLTLAGLALPAWAASNVLEQVQVTAGRDASQVVQATFKETVSGTPATFTTANPQRLIVDFAKTTSKVPKLIEGQGGALRNIRVLESGDRTRMVLELNEATRYELRTERNKVLITLRDAKAPSAASTVFTASDSSRQHGIRDIDFRRGKNGEGRIIVSLSDPGAGVDVKQTGQTLRVDFLNSSLPTALARRLDVTDFATPVTQIETFQSNGNTRMVIALKGKATHSAYQSGEQFIIEVMPVQEALTGKAGQYGGEKISLDFYNVEVRDLIKVIAELTGINIITSEKVGGTITLRLKDIPWDQALDIILTTKGLEKRTLGSNVIWIAPRAEMAEMDKNELEARQKISALEDLVTEVIYLNYLRADDAHAILNGRPATARQAETVTCTPAASGISAAPAQTTTATPTGTTGAGAGVQRLLSERGSASYDLKTNALFVRDIPSKIQEIRDVLAKVDVPARQVLIEARIVVADDGFSRNLGAKLGIHHQGSLNNGNRIGVSGTDFNSSPPPAQTLLGGINATTVASTNIGAANLNLPAGAIGGINPAGLGISLFGRGADLLINLELQALESDNRGKIVSSPRVITENQKPAVILQGTQIPVVTPGTANTPATVEYKDAMLCLLVSPQVLNNDTVILNVEVTKDAPGDEVVGTGNFPINTKRVKTQVRVMNGETAVLGGIFEQETRNDTTKVPLLGDIPVLGHLFKNNRKKDLKSELLIFLTPRVLPENTPPLR